ncbi:hypothetical protein VAE151_540010 [Vibrio aestuarianus]|uniref:Uncharacterized protein n=1 Tax=Vibrio aestuarianus TaxID=28171 RepID=A0ABM9FPZ6_9VIBR|nr:hypothetical protein VAE308_1040010 [Vibrio aestuarianus]CAH8190232.1 hypothetical protein VIBAE_A30587 [Vibrio aestuarianus subsp. francensis]CAH8190176.1 hypothetical protein VAE032_260010 [Vibrio aestuarianus]CAH8190301.1 hypothetical protein VAE055_360010 [Vibrio aestuarianus]CAH8190438.1 hypothetical protein VAE128_450010 [Vibrio aestuarianus]
MNYIVKRFQYSNGKTATHTSGHIPFHWEALATRLPVLRYRFSLARLEKPLLFLGKN